MLKRLLYLGYYIKELDRKKFALFLNKVKQETGRSSVAVLADIVYSSVVYNISILEYFQFHFYRLSKQQKDTYAGTGYMYEYQLKMNPRAGRSVLEDKLEFLDTYGRFVNHKYASLDELKQNEEKALELLSVKAGKLVFKNSHGQCGNGIEVLPVQGLNREKIVERLQQQGNDFVEEFVTQHPDLMKMSPSGLNTVRVVTQLNDAGGVDIVAARLRITINSAVDNLAAGNIAAVINIETGRVEGPGVYSDITKADEQFHPVTGTPIIGFQVPLWKETINMITGAAIKNINNRSVGWDIAITEMGPELIEGNHDWCKLLWQLPAQRGLKADLEKYNK